MYAHSQIETCSPRVLWREHRKTRRLREWDSLPCFRLRLENRPLFECQECRFANAFGIICPWCLCACEEPLYRGVRRRVSSPSLLSNAQKAQLKRIERHSCAALRESRFTAPCTSKLVTGPGERRKRHRHAAIYSATDVVAQASVDEGLQSVALHLMQLQKDPVSPATSPMPSAELEDGDASIEVVHIPPSPPTSSTPSHRTLRHKPGRLVLHQRSSGSLRRRATISESTAPHRQGRSMRFPVPSGKVDALSSASQPRHTEMDVPLGHPRRPLYTAIRNNMSPPRICEAPKFTGHGPPLPAVDDRVSRSLDLPRPTPDALRTLTAPQPPRFSTLDMHTGWSASGLAELRMGLARESAGEGVPYKYSFRDSTHDSPTKKEGKGLRGGLRYLLSRRN
ncbi:hypothetical protein BKA93DRAFT_68114 [Sparassis latifolia]|uniref:Uncharacterized protein n=1 Tax=Sparassis crispa TaxID=139825 RepID=A0A401H2C7_9APHY|nr:hypothetical protein SCP_1304020 [Sparassis crispa]GBE88585.1 hypothetical protein SCP_1304020 [Sparassis crispa]